MTNHQDQLVKNMQDAVAASPELQKQLATAQSSEQAASLLSTALGSPVSAADLQGLSDRVQSQMTDKQLDAVAGGISTRDIFILISVFSYGAGCALASLLYATNTAVGGCKGAMND